jgi:hypothetical protein
MGQHEKLETEFLFEKRVLRRIFGPKTELVTGGWRRLHNDELRDLFFWPDNIIMAIESWRIGFSVMWDT